MTNRFGGPNGPRNVPPLIPIPHGAGAFVGMHQDEVDLRRVVPGTVFVACHNCGGGVSRTPRSAEAAAEAPNPMVPVCHRCFNLYLASDAAEPPECSPIGERPILFRPLTPEQVAEADEMFVRRDNRDREI